MLLTEVMPQIRQAFKANIKPGAILWALMLIFFAAYATSATFSSGLGKVSALKISVGYPFSFGVYVLFAAVMPEMFKIMFFQKWRPTVQNLRNLVFVGLLFGCIGIVTDIFYLYQARWFGEAGDLRTLAMGLRDKLSSQPAVVALVGGEAKPVVIVATTDAARAAGAKAGQLVGVAAAQLGGKGGGKDDLAQGGGSDAAGTDAALAAIRDALAG